MLAYRNSEHYLWKAYSLPHWTCHNSQKTDFPPFSFYILDLTNKVSLINILASIYSQIFAILIIDESDLVRERFVLKYEISDGKMNDEKKKKIGTMYGFYDCGTQIVSDLKSDLQVVVFMEFILYTF